MNRFVKYVIALGITTTMSMPVASFAAEPIKCNNQSIPKISNTAFLEHFKTYISNQNICINKIKIEGTKVIVTKTTSKKQVATKVKKTKVQKTVVVSTKPSTTTKSAIKTQTPITAPQVNNSIATEILNLVNTERAREGLSPLKLNAALSNVATIKAKDLYDNNYFDHNSPTYGSPFDMMKKFGISYTAAGENIAKGQPDAQEVIAQWMNSPDHRANIMNPNYTELGVGHVGTVWVQMFIRP